MKSFILNYSEIATKNKMISHKIGESLSKNGNGYIVIKNIPNFNTMRKQLLSIGNKFLNSSETILSKYRSDSTKYYKGYSDIPFVTDDGVKHLNFNSFVGRPTKDTLKSIKYPDFEEGFKNIWPEEEFPELKKSFQDLGKIISTCQNYSFHHVCTYLNDIIPNFENDVHKELVNNIDVVSRLINYFPRSVACNKVFDGWHTDYSLFTAITHPMFFDKSVQVTFNQTCLKIMDRTLKEIEVDISEDDLLIFPSNAFHIISGGNIVSTPHVVELNVNKDAKFNFNRLTLATFFQPSPDYVLKLPKYTDFKESLKKTPHMSEYFEENKTYQEYSENLLNYLIQRKI